MSFWEKGYLAVAAILVLAGGGYFYTVWQQSITLGSVAPPSWSTFGVYLLVITVLTLTGVAVLGRVQTINNRTSDIDEMINLKSLAAASHVTSAAVYASLVWFLFYGDGSLLFHSTVGALIVGELCLCMLQVFNYNRAY